MTKMYVKISNVLWGWEKIDLIEKQFHLNNSAGETDLEETEIRQIKKPLSLSFLLDKKITIDIYVNPKIAYSYKFNAYVMKCDYYLCKLTYSGLRLIKKERDVVLREDNGIGNNYDIFYFFSKSCFSYEETRKVNFFKDDGRTFDDLLRELGSFYSDTSDYEDNESDDDVYCNPSIMNQFWK